MDAHSFDNTMEERERILLDTVEFGAGERAYLNEQFSTWLGADKMQNYDRIAANVFLRLARADEYKTLERCNNECWEAGVKWEEGDYQSPIIDDILDIQPNDIKWPGGKRFAVCLTHDIDILHYNLIRQRLRSLKYYRKAPLRNKAMILLSILNRLTRFFEPKPDFPIDAWMKIEDKYGFRSTMFFLAGPPANPHYSDGFYYISDKVNYYSRRRPLRDVLPEIAAAGWDVGLHGGINSAFDGNILCEEREKLSNTAKTEVISGRQHYLVYDIRRSPVIHEKAKLLVDSSLGSNIHPYVYRCGTGLPHKMYDSIEKRIIDVLQIPMIVQDVPLIKAARRDVGVAFSIIFNILKSAAARGSAITLSFHNDHFEDDVYFTVYAKALQAAYDLGAWGCSAKEMYNWYSGYKSHIL